MIEYAVFQYTRKQAIDDGVLVDICSKYPLLNATLTDVVASENFHLALTGDPPAEGEMEVLQNILRSLSSDSLTLIAGNDPDLIEDSEVPIDLMHLCRYRQLLEWSVFFAGRGGAVPYGVGEAVIIDDPRLFDIPSPGIKHPPLMKWMSRHVSESNPVVLAVGPGDDAEPVYTLMFMSDD